MKKIQLSFFNVAVLIFISISLQAQPQLVGPLGYGGPQNGGGLFRLNLPGTTPGMVHLFNKLSPHRPTGGVVAGDDDWLYGSITYNGTNNEGAAYRIRRDGTGFIKLFDFGAGAISVGTPYYHTDGKVYFNAYNSIKVFDPSVTGVTTLDPQGLVLNNNLWIDADDYIYYITFGERLVRIKTDGSLYEELHLFNSATEGLTGTIGVTPIPGNRIFGVMKYNGLNGGGTIYSINSDGTNFTVHHQFEQATGIEPESKLFYFDGKLFGTARQGGDNLLGVLYAIDANGTNYRVLRHFETSFGTGNPSGNIQISADGRIFGCYPQHHLDNSFIANRLWKADTSGANLENFFSVDQRQNGQYNLDILLSNDTIFLATQERGRHEGGVISYVDTFGNGPTPIHHFGAVANGFWPKTAVIKASDGKLYGTASVGGPDGNGVVYSINAAGTGFLNLHTFLDAEGYEPAGELLEASNGKIYGGLRFGGPINTGCIYRMDKNGANFQIIYNFPDVTNAHWPVGDLIEGPGLVVYGMFEQSSNGSGIFRMNLDGSNFTVIKHFASGELGGPGSGLRLYRGYLYGFSYAGGTGRGGIFRIRLDGTGYQEMHVFNGTDGSLPMESPVIGRTDGKIYGTASQGGTDGFGLVFSIDTSGTGFTILHQFATEAPYPHGQLIQASDGLLYGTTFWSNIGPGGGGIVFRLNTDGSGFLVLKEFNSETEGAGPGSIMDLTATALPVQWGDFIAKQKEQTVLLEWKTVQEQNADQFIIERSNTNATFQPIGTITATGNTTTGTSYSFTDTDPFYGDNYYRLKQTDRDGNFTYSKTVRISFESRVDITLSPNPAQDNLTINLPANQTAKNISVTDASGRLVLRFAPGNRPVITIPVHNLSKGMYWLQVQTGQKSYRMPFMKQ